MSIGLRLPCYLSAFVVRRPTLLFGADEYNEIVVMELCGDKERQAILIETDKEQ